MNPALKTALDQWQAAFKQELLGQLAELRADADIYGFAVEVPEDLGNLAIATAAGRESKLSGEEPGSLHWLTQRYSPVEWQFLPDARFYPRTDALLEAIARDHGHWFTDENGEYTREAVAFRDALYAAILDTLAECDAEGAFGHIWYKILFLSDGEHPIVRQSLRRLNRGRALKEAPAALEGPSLFRLLTNRLWLLYVRTIRRRKYRRNP